MPRRPVRRIVRGAPIRALWLNDIVDTVNELTGVGPPEQQNEPQSPIINEQGETVVEPTPTEVWVEVCRIESVVRVTNPEDSAQYVDTAVIDEIVFRRPDTSCIRLVINNPD